MRFHSLHGIIARFGTDLRGALDNASELCGLTPRIPPAAPAADGSQQQVAAATSSDSAALEQQQQGESGAAASATGAGTSGSTALVDQAELDSSPLLTDPAAAARREQLLSRLASSTPQLPTRSSLGHSPADDRELVDLQMRATASPPLSPHAGFERERPVFAPGREQMVVMQVGRQAGAPQHDEYSASGVRARRAAPFEAYLASRSRSTNELEHIRLPANLPAGYADPTFSAAAPPVPDGCSTVISSLTHFHTQHTDRFDINSYSTLYTVQAHTKQ